MSRSTVIRTVVRAVVGVVTLGIGAAAIAAATALPLPTLSEQPAGAVVTPVALDQQRVCAGSLLRLSGDTSSSATTVTSVGPAATVTAAGGGDTPSSTPLQGADTSGSDPLLVTASAKGGTTVPSVAASQSQTAAAGDLKGFAAAPCAEPVSSTWLVGGSTETGRTTLVSLVNATEVNSTVDLALAGENGTVEGPGLTGIVVAPRSQKVVPLSGFATGLASPVVHVTSRGGQISATLQVGIVRTLAPGGADIVSASAAPSTVTSVPGIVVRDGAAIQTQLGTAGYDDLKTALRVYTPGATDAKITVQLSTVNGTGTTFSSTAPAGQVTDFPVDGLPDGLYTATVQSSAPVVVGARSSSATDNGDADVSWVGSAPGLSGSTLFSVPQGPRSTLTLANPGAKALSVRLSPLDPSEKAQVIAVPAGSSAEVGVTQGVSYFLSDGGAAGSADGLRAAVSFSETDAIAAFAVVSAQAVSSPVTVYP